MNENKILLISGIVSAVILVLSFLSYNNTPLFINMVILSIISLVMPYSMYRFIEFKKIKLYEKEFPGFLRDLSESKRAGLTIAEGIKHASKSDYGFLNSEIKKMKNQLSWNIPLEIVFSNFGKRVKRSNIISRSLIIMSQATKSGGDVENTFESLANSMESIKEVQKEKKVLLNQQVIMMYAIFFIFLGISIALIKFLIPLLQSQTQIGGSFGLVAFNANPCFPCIDGKGVMCFGCEIFFTMSSAFGFGEKADPSSYYKSLFFAMVLIQGLFSGLISGQIGSDSISAGIKHSLIMLLSGFLIFITVVKLGII